MTNLSPAAQAVFNAAWTCPIVLGDHPVTRSRQIAAALRAAADQVVPTTVDPRLSTVRSDLMRIARELETSTTENP